MAVKLGGKKGEKYDLGQNADINVTPFVDVMLVLLIIFMVTIPVATVSIRVDLPPALTTVHRPSSLDGLAYDLAKKFNVAKPTEEVVMIRADADVRYEQFMNVLNALQD